MSFVVAFVGFLAFVRTSPRMLAIAVDAPNGDAVDHIAGKIVEEWRKESD